MESDTVPNKINLGWEAWWCLGYFALYLGYLFLNQESEWGHWVTLVSLPIIYLVIHHRKSFTLSLGDTLASTGLQKGNLKSGLLGAFILGIFFSILQLFLSRQSNEQWEIIRSGQVLILFPLAFLLLLLTAGFTEEFFFRGILQTRLMALFNSKFWGILVTSFLFGLYHVPYAYLNPNWPSHGNWMEALNSAFGQGIPIGLILGYVYVRSHNNLASSVLLHSLINVLPAMTIIQSKML